MHPVFSRAFIVLMTAVSATGFAVALPLPSAHAKPAADSAARTPAAETADGGRYFGPLVDGRFDGRGRLEWDSGAVYEGEFRKGLLHGRGRMKYANGDVYEGSFVAGVESGHGRLKTAGGTYVGGFRNGEYDGQGRFDDGHGTSYEGGFRSGLYHGRGVLKSFGDDYRGDFRRGEFSGTGEIRYRDGRVFRGQVLRGRYHGRGRFEEPSGAAYEGDFESGEFTGEGVYTAPGGLRHEGTFRNWQPHGAGRFADGRGNAYEGQFVEGRLTGTATVTSSDGARYRGEVMGWIPHGRGELLRPNGDRYSGHFSFGQFDGDGTLVYAKPQADGRTQDSGLWRHGRLQKDAEEERRHARQNVETAIYSQQALLDAALKRLAPRAADGINMYLLAVGGDGQQEVFRREVEFVRAMFDRDFGTRGRSMLLVNSRSTAGREPLATVTSLRRSLQAIADKMDKRTDILFMFITSHGSRQHELTLGLKGLDLPGIGAADLAAALKDTGIQWKVLVISACYAGGFIEPLRDPGTLILTAARHDRRSFGCADENDFTYFGRAFFKEALPISASFDAAFKRADALITEWERRDAEKATPAQSSEQHEQSQTEPPRDPHSLPQIDSPDPVRAHLAKWWAQHKRPAADAAAEAIR